jgi:hypothetical protein
MSLLAGLALALCLNAAAAEKPFLGLPEPKIDKELGRIHKKHAQLDARVDAVSRRFLGMPYKLGPLGEGEDGEFDRDPLYSFSQVDCTTYVEEVMALSLRPKLSDALKELDKIRYADGKVGYATRLHFTEADWVPKLVWAGYLRDITRQVAGDKTVGLVKKVSKREWYTKMSTSNIEGRFTPAEKAKRLPALQALGESMQDQNAALDILPMDALPEALPRIPTGTIANLVREPLPDKPTMVSHQVLLIKAKDGGTLVRHAASGKAVVEQPALEYFYKYFNSKWRLVGLNLNLPRDPKQPEAPRP